MDFIDQRNDQSLQILKRYLLRRESFGGAFRWTNGQIESHFRNQKLWLAKTQDGEIAALVLFSALPQLVDIHYLETNPYFIRSGRMESLFSELFLRYRDADFWLEVHEGNLPARALYAKLGFVETALRRNYYRDGGHSVQMSLGA